MYNINSMNVHREPPYRFAVSLAGISLVALGLLAVRVATSDSFRYGFMVWNLVLATVPLVLAWWLVTRVDRLGWLSWQQIILTLAWIVFLPNSFYLITDFVHLRVNYEADIFFDIGLLTSFVLAGLMYGYVSVYMVHQRLLKRMRERSTYLLLGLLFLAVSFAICLGRYTRWNTWDILLKPAGLLFDVSERVINPNAHLQTYATTAVMFLLLFGGYAIVYEAIRLIKSTK